MRYVGDLITLARGRTGNSEFTVGSSTSVIEDITEGIGNQQILEFFNEGQAHLQSAIVNVHPQTFLAHKEITVVSNTEEYTIPDNIFVGNRIVSVEYSDTGNARDYCILDQRSIRDRDTDTDSHPSFYIQRNGKILLNPIPTSSTAKIRVTFYRELDRLGLRAGDIDAITLSATQLTALSVAITDDLSNLINNITDKYFNVVTKDGAVTMYNVPYTVYSTSTGDFTFSAFTFATGETGTTSDFVTIGKYTATHSGLPDNCERYLLAFAQLRLLQMDSSVDWTDEANTLNDMERDIVDSFGDVEGIMEFPVDDWYALL